MSLLFDSPGPPPWSACGGLCTPLGGMMSLVRPLTKVNGSLVLNYCDGPDYYGLVNLSIYDGPNYGQVIFVFLMAQILCSSLLWNSKLGSGYLS